MNKKEQKQKNSKDKISLPSSSCHLFELASFEGHVNSIESLDSMNLNPDFSNSKISNDFILTGDWSGNVFVWDILHNQHIQTNIETFLQNSDSLLVPNDQLKNRKKSKKNTVNTTSTDENEYKNNLDIAIDIKPLYTIHAHAHSVSDIKVIYDTNNSSNYTMSYATHFLTSSWDHHIKKFNIETQDSVHTFSTTKVVTSIDYSSHLNAVISSHTDGKLRLWDFRQPDHNMQMDQDVNMTSNASVVTFGKDSYTQWISQVRIYIYIEFIF